MIHHRANSQQPKANSQQPTPPRLIPSDYPPLTFSSFHQLYGSHPKYHQDKKRCPELCAHVS